ncbi:unnamed protein product, partial [marine sediment metagenome]
MVLSFNTEELTDSPKSIAMQGKLRPGYKVQVRMVQVPIHGKAYLMVQRPTSNVGNVKPGTIISYNPIVLNYLLNGGLNNTLIILIPYFFTGNAVAMYNILTVFLHAPAYHMRPVTFKTRSFNVKHAYVLLHWGSRWLLRKEATVVLKIRM